MRLDTSKDMWTDGCLSRLVFTLWPSQFHMEWHEILIYNPLPDPLSSRLYQRENSHMHLFIHFFSCQRGTNHRTIHINAPLYYYAFSLIQTHPQNLFKSVTVLSSLSLFLSLSSHRFFFLFKRCIWPRQVISIRKIKPCASLFTWFPF